MGRIRGIEVELEQIPGGFLAWLLLPRVSKLSHWAVRDLEFTTEHGIPCGTYDAAAMRALLKRAPDYCIFGRFFFGALQRVTGMRYALMRTFCAARAIFFASVLTPTISSYT